MKKIITIGILLFVVLIAKSQHYKFSYDNNGNRIKREFIPLRMSQDTITDSTSILKDSAIRASTNNNPQQMQLSQQQQKYETTLGDQKINVYPNPTKGELNIEITNLLENSHGIIQVTDMQGMLIYKDESITASKTINLSKAAPGSYIMRVVINNESHEWIIEKQ